MPVSATQKFPRAPVNGPPVALSADVYNALCDAIERSAKWTVTPPLKLQSVASGNYLSSTSSSSQETVLVAIIDKETGGGYYKGSIATGTSNGGNGANPANAPGTYNFQIQVSSGQSQLDGPVAPISGGHYVNNALVVNLLEQFTPGTHNLLDFGATYPLYVQGRIMGTTVEATPRTIIYVSEAPCYPAMAQITAAFTGGSTRGVYSGKIFQANNGNGSGVYSLSTSWLPANDDCLIINLWEQQFQPSANWSLAANTQIGGWVCGYKNVGATLSPATSFLPAFYCVQPPQAAVLTHTIQAITTVQNAGASYTSNEQTMLTNLKTDVTNLRLSLLDLYTNLQTVGYIK